MHEQTELSRSELKANRTIVPRTELKLWEANPREVIDISIVMKDMRGAQTVPLLVTADGVVLGGNTRFQAMQRINKPEVWVSVVEFKEENGKYIPYVNGERDIYEFKTKEDGMKHYALKNNQEYARYINAEIVEIALDSALNLDDYTFRSEDGKIMSLSEMMAESNGEVLEHNPDVLEPQDLRGDTDMNTASLTSPKEKELKIVFRVEFPFKKVKETGYQEFEIWLNNQVDGLMLSMLDQFKEAKDKLQ